jgi:hypothetical protein
MERIEYIETTNSKPTIKEAQAIGSYIVAEYIRLLKQENPLANISVHLPTPTIQKFVRTYKNTNNIPTKCYTTNWDIYSHVASSISQTNTTTKVITTQTQKELHQWIRNTNDPIQHPTLHTVLDIAEAHLCHSGCRVGTDYTALLRNISTASPAEKYFQEKYNWNEDTVQDIAWREHGTALQRIKRRRHKSTIQTIHQWLPVNASPTRGLLGTARLCPYCNSCEENQHHYYNCLHDDLRLKWSEAASNIRKKILKLHQDTHHQLLKLLHSAVTEWRTIEKPQRPDYLIPSFYNLFQQQSHIGWNQIILGRISQAWLSATNSTNPSSWLTSVISIIWQQTHEVWVARCARNHGTEPNSKRSRVILKLKPQVESLFNAQSSLPTSEAYIFANSIEEVLNMPTFSLSNWVFKATNRIKRARQNQRQSNKKKLPLHPFFSNTRRKTPVKTKPKQYNKRCAPKVATSLLTYFSRTPKLTIQRKTSQPKNDLKPP